ncbi:hypothetical protein PV325_001214 [Microctonus aethiopoides]|uniref:EGF-like domain-containing protein n=1 Tax=Microctonus aethiopoides TaxID=144406 RepID=A0AA39FZR2_9HYME|nr:hypothetical protein PV325_001214 [Microctonus aethiopoides]KAK0178159.1 hypothetical protein PV328_002136 [Microctonus aethiopoides]
MKAIFIILICVPCLLPILIIDGSELGQIINNNCTNDTDCDLSEKCSNNKCIYVCNGVSCGPHGYCTSNKDHTSSCICEARSKINSSITDCITHCIHDTDCDPFEKCSNNKCIFACDGVSCGSEAHCQIYYNHKSSCTCGPNLEFESNWKKCVPHCRNDTDCGPFEKCSNNKCIFACAGVSCGPHGYCISNNDHTSSCICEARSKINSSITDCILPCTDDTDCDPFEKCSNNECIFACDEVSCGHHGQCIVYNDHKSACVCEPTSKFNSTIGNCAPHCTNDTDCDPFDKCTNNKCISACDGVSCGSEAYCQMNSNHTSSCICGPNLEFDSHREKCVPHCTHDTDCDRFDKCSNNKCISACDGVSCGRHGHCIINNNHESACVCGPKSKFNSIIGECVTHCTHDTDCDPLEKCSNNKCIFACDGVSCGRHGHCEPESNHTSWCYCHPKLKFDSSFKECGSHVITNNGTSHTFSVIGRYIQFYFKGNEPVGVVIIIHNIATDQPNQYFVIITDKDIRTQIDLNVTVDTLPPSTLSADEYRGFWFKFDDTTIKFGKMENNTSIREYVIENGSIINSIRLISTNDTEWFVAGLLPEELNTN